MNLLRTLCVCLALLASVAHGAPDETVERRVAANRRGMIESIKKILSLSNDPKEVPQLMRRLGELYREEAVFHELEAKKQQAPEEKAALLAKAAEFRTLSTAQYVKLAESHPNFELADEVLYVLGQRLMEDGHDRKALVVYKRLVEKYPQSKYVPDAHLAVGDFYFNHSKGKRPELEKALAAYTQAAGFPKSSGYTYALYRQGWCHFHLADYAAARDRFKAVALGGGQLAREAQEDYVRAYARDGDVTKAREDFSQLAVRPEDRFAMMKQLAHLYSGEDKHHEAALAFSALLQEQPPSPESAMLQAQLVDVTRRMGDKARTLTQAHQLVKALKAAGSSGAAKEEQGSRLLDEASALAERTLSQLAVLWHDDARKTPDTQALKYAAAILDDYLALFPEGPRATELRKLREERHRPVSVKPAATPPPPPEPVPPQEAGEQAPTVKGPVNLEEIRSIIRSHVPEVRGCYQVALTRHPRFEAKVVVKFTINEKGTVVLSEIASRSVRVEDLESCLTEHVKGWRFPRPSGGGTVVVSYPFSFRPAPAADEARP